MPLSPFSRFLLVLIIALAGAALVLTDLWDPTLLTAAAGAFAMVLAAFSSRVVKDTPPTDDHAFHLTLPPGHGGGFRRILCQHALLLGGIGAVIAARCVYLGGTWLGGVMAAFLLCLPVLAVCAAMATAAALSVKPGKWRLFAFAALVLPPSVSFYFMEQARMFPPAGADWFALPVVLTAAILYLLGWLFAGLGRMRVAGVVTLAATGALLPWLVVRGDSRDRPAEWPLVRQERAIPEPGPRPASEALVRKPKGSPDKTSTWMPDLPELQGLEDGEFLLIHSLKVLKPRENPPWSPAMESSVNTWLGKGDTGPFVGEAGIWRHLLARLPAQERLSFDPPFRWEALSWMNRSYLGSEAPSVDAYPWEVRLTGPYRWELAGPFELARGGSARLPSGLFVKIIRSERESHPLSVRVFGTRPTLLDPRYFGQVFGKPVHTMAPHVFLVARDGKTGLAVGTSIHGPSRLDPHLMEFEDWEINCGPEGGQGMIYLTDGEKPYQEIGGIRAPSSIPDSRDLFERGRLYVFVPVLQPGGFRDGVIPPP